MSRENLDLALLMYEAFDRRDLDGMLALMHDEVEIEPRLGALEGDYRGHEGVRRWWSDLLDVLPDYAAEVDELDDLGDMTLGQIRGTAHGATSSTPVVETWWQSRRHDAGLLPRDPRRAGVDPRGPAGPSEDRGGHAPARPDTGAARQLTRFPRPTRSSPSLRGSGVGPPPMPTDPGMPGCPCA